MDKTPVWFDMAGNFTINTKGEKIVQQVMKKIGLLSF